MPSTPHWRRSASRCPTRKPVRPMQWPVARRSPTTRRCVAPSLCCRPARDRLRSSNSAPCCVCPNFKPSLRRRARRRDSTWRCAPGRRARLTSCSGSRSPMVSRAPSRSDGRPPCSDCEAQRERSMAPRQSTDQPLGVAVDHGLRSGPLGAAPSLVEQRVSIGGTISRIAGGARQRRSDVRHSFAPVR